MSKLQMWEKYIGKYYIVNNGHIYDYTSTEWILKRIKYLWILFNALY